MEEERAHPIIILILVTMAESDPKGETSGIFCSTGSYHVVYSGDDEMQCDDDTRRKESAESTKQQ